MSRHQYDSGGRRDSRWTIRRWLGALAAASLLACAAADPDVPPIDATGTVALTSAERGAIADSITRLLVAATDLAPGGDAGARMLALYPDTGQVISASGGYLIVGRDSVAAAIRGFWESVGQNMVRPEWRWGRMHVDVLGRDAAVVSATYRVPHMTPTGRAHVVGGAWTAVFANRDGRWVIVQEHLSDVVGGMSLTP